MGIKLDSAVTLGAIQGILDVGIKGRLAIKEQEKLEAKAKAERKQTAQDNLISTLTSENNSYLASAFLNDTSNLGSFLAMPEDSRTAIFLNANRIDKDLLPEDQAVFDKVMGDYEFARNVMSLDAVYRANNVFPTIEKLTEKTGLQVSAFTEPEFKDLAALTGVPDISPENIATIASIRKLPLSYRAMMQAFGTQDKMTSNELQLLRNLPADAEQRIAQSSRLIKSGVATPGTKFHALLSHEAAATIPPKPYERLTEEDIGLIEKEFKGKDGVLRADLIAPALQRVQLIRQKILDKHVKVVKDADGKERYSGPFEVFLDISILDGLIKKYGTQESTLQKEATTADIITMLKEGVENVSKFGDDEIAAKTKMATDVLKNVAAFVGDPGVLQDIDAGTPGFQVAPSIPARAQADFLTLKNISSIVEKVATDTYVYTSNNKTVSVETGKSIQENPGGYLEQLNTQIAGMSYNAGSTDGTSPRKVGDNAIAFYTAMTPPEKQKFEAEVTAALKGDFVARNTDTYKGEDKLREAQGPRAYAFSLGELYELPFVKNVVHNELRLPKPDETATGKPTNSTPQVNSNTGAELSEDEYAMTSSSILRVTDAVKSLAASQNVTTHDFFNHSDLHYRMIDVSNYQNPFYLFEAANVIAGMGFFKNRVDAPLREKDIASIAQVFVRFGITNRNDQLDVISVAMSGDLPAGLAISPDRTTMTLAEANKAFKQLTASGIDDKKLEARRSADDTFLLQADNVLDLLATQPKGSRLTTDIRVKFANLFTVEDSVAKQALQAGGKALSALGLYNPDDYVDAASQLRIESATANFLQNEFLKNDAKLASALVKFAYNFAKTMDEAGRISERDYIAALKAVNADLLSSREVRIETVEDLKRQALDGITRHNRLFDLKQGMQSGQFFFAPTRSQIKQMRSLRYFGDVVRATGGLEEAQEFAREIASLGGTVSQIMNKNTNVQAYRDFQGKYTLQFATDAFGPSAATPGQQIYQVKQKILGDDAAINFVRGVPLYVNANGEFLSQEEIRARRIANQ